MIEIFNSKLSKNVTANFILKKFDKKLIQYICIPSQWFLSNFFKMKLAVTFFESLLLKISIITSCRNQYIKFDILNNHLKNIVYFTDVQKTALYKHNYSRKAVLICLPAKKDSSSSMAIIEFIKIKNVTLTFLNN